MTRRRDDGLLQPLFDDLSCRKAYVVSYNLCRKNIAGGISAEVPLNNNEVFQDATGIPEIQISEDVIFIGCPARVAIDDLRHSRPPADAQILHGKSLHFNLLAALNCLQT